jgi:hypothetical protein
MLELWITEVTKVPRPTDLIGLLVRVFKRSLRLLKNTLLNPSLKVYSPYKNKAKPPNKLKIAIFILLFLFL